MATLKYSRQREVIKEYLASTKEHPTAIRYICMYVRHFQRSVLEPSIAI